MEKKGKGLMVIGKLPNLTSFVIVRKVSVLISLPGPYIYGLGIYMYNVHSTAAYMCR